MRLTYRCLSLQNHLKILFCTLVILMVQARQLTGNVVDLPDTRSWSYATVKLRRGKPVIEAKSLVNHSLPLRRQSEIIDEWKVPA